MRIGKGSIYPHGAGYAIRYWLHGEQRYKGGFKTKSAAQGFLSDMLSKKSRGEPIPAHTLIVDQLLADALTHWETIKKVRTLKDKRTHIDDHLLPFFSGWRVSELTAADVEEYGRARLAQHAKPASVNREISDLRFSFNHAFRQGRISHRIHFPMLPGERTRTVAFKDSEYLAFREKLPDDVGAATDFQIETGARISEVLSLRWSNVDFENALVFWEPEKTKNKAAKVHPFTDRLRVLVESQRLKVDQLQRELGRIIPYVFPRYCCKKQFAGRAMVYFDSWKQKEGPAKYFYNAWDKALKAAMITDKTSHDLRRTAAIRRDASGISQDSNMKLGGWKTPAMLQRYLDAKDVEDLRAELRKLDAARTVTKPSQNDSSPSGLRAVNH